MEERLQKIISVAGVASRRMAEKMIMAGRVSVDGHEVTELGHKYDWSAHDIRVDGRRILAAERQVYFLLNKPKGYISTAKDDRGRRTVLNLLPDIKERVYPVGRLDADTEGLLILTNDGKLMNALLHPRQEIEKTYVALVSNYPTEEDLDKLRCGIRLDDGMTAPAKVRTLGSRGEWTQVEVVIHEGRNRQVRRMFAAINAKVRSLRRTEFAGLNLSGVKRGRYRELTTQEVAYLRALAGLAT